MQKYMQVSILLITVLNKAILTVMVIQDQSFASYSDYRQFVQISHANKALIPPQILGWGERGYLAIFLRLTDAQDVTDHQFGVASQRGQSEQGPAV